jgi:hypothetical protein
MMHVSASHRSNHPLPPPPPASFGPLLVQWHAAPSPSLAPSGVSRPSSPAAAVTAASRSGSTRRRWSRVEKLLWLCLVSLFELMCLSDVWLEWSLPRLPPPAEVALRAKLRAAAWNDTDTKVKRMMRTIVVWYIELTLTDKYDKKYGWPLSLYRWGQTPVFPNAPHRLHPDKALMRDLCTSLATWIHQTQKHNEDIEKRAGLPRNSKRKTSGGPAPAR